MKPPIYYSLVKYNKELFLRDCIAGLITASIAVPQTMAYARLAGVPTQYGLFSALLPLVIYAIWGSSRTLVVGPAAIICLLVSSTITRFSPDNVHQYVQISFNLALLTGMWLILLNLLKLGNLANLISKPVMTGFTSASALIICTSQLPTMFGLNIGKGLSVFETVIAFVEKISDTNFIILFISIIAILWLWFAKFLIPMISSFVRLPSLLQLALVKSMPILVIVLSVIAVLALELNKEYEVAILGYIPNALPELTTGLFDVGLWKELAIPSLSIALLSFITSLSTATILASKRHEKVKPNQELFALGAANIGSSFIGSFPLAGSVSRSIINFSAGATTQISNLICAIFVLVTILFLTPYFYYLPISILSAIVMVSVLPMIKIEKIKQSWQFNKSDAISLFVTFATTLIFGVEIGIWSGVLGSLVLFIQRSSQPHIAEVGRTENGHFRNVNRLSVETLDTALFLRIDSSLFFANISHIENDIISRVNNRHNLENLVIIFSSISSIDQTALETLERIIVNLKNKQITTHLSDVKGVIKDQLNHTDFIEKLSPGRLFYTTEEAMAYLKTT